MSRIFWKVNYFIQDFIKARGKFDRVLDVGSKDFNGSVRDSFREAHSEVQEFIGVDMQEGKGVDIVLNGHDLTKQFEFESFDLVTCCETFEHDNQFWVTLEEMKKVLKKGGWLLITCPGLYFIHHDYPSDYYRFTKQAVEEFFNGFTDIYVEEFADPNDIKEKPNTSIMGYGRKKL